MRRRELLRGLAGCLLFANTVLAGIRTEEIAWGQYKGVVGESFEFKWLDVSEGFRAEVEQTMRNEKQEAV